MMAPAKFQQVEPSGERSPRVLIAGIWMVPSCGGMVKTINSFRQALGASVVSFSNRDQLDAEGSAVPDAVHLCSEGGWAGRLYNWVPNRERLKAESAVQNADLLSCHTLYRYHVNWVRYWARRRGLPYWVVPHGCLDPYVYTYRAFTKRVWMRLLGRRHLREAHSVIFATRKEHAKARPFLDRDNARVIHWPVEVPVECSSADAVAGFRSELGIASEDRLLLSIGRLHPMKRVPETVSAFLQADHPRVHLAVAGPEEGTTYAQLRALAGDHPRLHLLGSVWGERRRVLQGAADGFISLSIRENFGHSAAEALAAGSPVILSPGNDLTGELEGLDVGWMLPDDSVASATSAIIEFSDTPKENVAAMGARGRSWVARELSFAKFRERLIGLAQETVRRPRSNSKAQR